MYHKYILNMANSFTHIISSKKKCFTHIILFAILILLTSRELFQYRLVIFGQV